MTGILYLVATPIGNLEDITLRAIRVLGEADIIAAEDTRLSGRLLAALAIKKPLISYYEHNKSRRGEDLLKRLLAGETVALISDAGLPGISDPGADLLRQVLAAGIEVCVLPGPNAALTALVASGLPTERFAFEGFLPREGAKRRAALGQLATEQRTMIFYEAPHRLLATLADMAAAWGEERAAAAGRELTKLHEEIQRGSLGQLLAHFQETAPRGEFTLVVAGAKPLAVEPPDQQQLLQELTALLAEGLPRKEAARRLAESYGLSVKQIYDLGLRDN